MKDGKAGDERRADPELVEKLAVLLPPKVTIWRGMWRGNIVCSPSRRTGRERPVNTLFCMTKLPQACRSAGVVFPKCFACQTKEI